jgi:hypothetical protein
MFGPWMQQIVGPLRVCSWMPETRCLHWLRILIFAGLVGSLVLLAWSLSSSLSWRQGQEPLETSERGREDNWLDPLSVGTEKVSFPLTSPN